jgi:DNA-binding Xre family transcriptional regulator
MTYPVLKANGHKFWEQDHYDGGIYLYTDEYWACDGMFYIHSEHPNANRYTGRTTTECYGPIKKAYDNDFYSEYFDRGQIKEAYDRMVAELETKNTPPTSLKDFRLAAGLTQKQLADASGQNLRQIQKLESGEAKIENITAKNLLAIADALNVDPHELL